MLIYLLSMMAGKCINQFLKLHTINMSSEKNTTRGRSSSVHTQVTEVKARVPTFRSLSIPRQGL